MIKAFTIPIFLIFSILTSFAQTLEYDIYLKNDIIGSLKAERTNVGVDDHFLITTNAKIKFVFSFDLHNIFKSNYKNGLLQYSYTRNLINENEKEKTETILKENGYQVIIDENDEKIIKQPINFSVACLYHKVPKGVSKVYSERFGCFLPLIEFENNKFELTLPDNKKNQYHYDELGVCEKVLVEQTFANLTILLRH